MSSPTGHEADELTTIESPRIDSARNRLVKAAATLFCRYGINATGVDAVVEVAGTAKATLYKIFGSKEGLVEAVLEEEGIAWRQWFMERLERYPGSPADKLAGIFDILGEWFEDERFLGCPFLNTIAECDKRETRYRRVAIEHKSHVLRRIAEVAEAAGCHDANKMAREICMLMDGAIVAALITRDAAVARQARTTAEKLVLQNTSQ
jgi:AcrR family transcriptional regulator